MMTLQWRKMRLPILLLIGVLSHVDQLIQAVAAFSAQTSLTWDQAIDPRPSDVQIILAASWV